MLPATADALSVEDGEVPEPQGLERNFSIGETFPWKGIWFRVSAVSADRILLEPTGETWKHHKKRTGRE